MLSSKAIPQTKRWRPRTLAEVDVGTGCPPPPWPTRRQPQEKIQAWAQPPLADRGIRRLPSATHAAEKTARNPTKHRLTDDSSDATQHRAVATLHLKGVPNGPLLREAVLSQTPPQTMLTSASRPSATQKQRCGRGGVSFGGLTQAEAPGATFSGPSQVPPLQNRCAKKSHLLRPWGERNGAPMASAYDSTWPQAAAH